MLKKFLLLPFLIFAAVSTAFAILPNPLISRFKPIYASFTGSPTSIVNGKFGETAWTITDSSWVAIKLDSGPKKIFMTWNSPNYMWSDVIANPAECAEGLAIPTSYNILVSGNSTNGVDGTWKVTDSITGNSVAARGHVIDFDGQIWVKMEVFSGGGKIDEIEIFDITNSAEDTWFFLGTSITAHIFKKPVPFKDFRYFTMDYVKDFNPKVIPAIIRGGIGCIKASGVAADINKYLEIAGNVNYFAIELGLNDAWGGKTDDLASFTKSMQLIISACRKKGVTPVIARPMATNPEKTSWQINESFLKAIDNLVKKNKLTPGPDLFTWFKQNPEELKEDGIHPNQRGSQSIHRLWAEAVYSLYKPKENAKK
jgi:lysophospholipase L1-like esterase